MKITKFGHSCLLIEESGVHLLTDPGSMNEVPAPAKLDAILITHEHQDHFDIDKIKALVALHPGVVLITHPAVGAKLEEAGLAYTPIEPGAAVEVGGVTVESYGTDHAIIYGDTPPCRNTGYLIANRLFMPGDALHDVPGKPVEILALPTGGPWMKMSEAVDYAKRVLPKVAFPIHDAMYSDDYRQRAVPRWMGNFLPPEVTFKNLLPGESVDLV